MATLTETAYYTRKAINWGILGIFVLFFLKISFDFAVSTWQRIHPPPPPPPTVAFGKLPVIKFPAKDDVVSPSAGLNFNLETIEGGLPNIQPTGTVYFISKPAVNLMSATRGVQFAAQLGFTAEPQKETETLYRWESTNNLLRKLELDIVTNNFKIIYDYTSDISLFTEKSLPNTSQAVEEAKSYLDRVGLAAPALLNGETTTGFWQLSGDKLIPTTTLSSADTVRVDFGREDINELKVYPPHPPYQTVYFIFSGSRDQNKRTIEISFKFWNIELEQSATYPLKTVSIAWEELKDSGGYIARMAKNAQAVVVRKVSLGYYYSEEYQSFLQPIFVFEGDPDFVGYVPAISPDWVE